MTNLEFFKGCWINEMSATKSLFQCLPDAQLDYQPHHTNRSAREIVEHLLAHVVDLKVIIENALCDETLVYDFASAEDAAVRLEELWNATTTSLENCTEEQWNTEPVELTIEGKPFVTLPRMQMMWFFFFDMIHHRGQLSSYVRPMGGKNPAIYGYSADTKVNAEILEVA